MGIYKEALTKNKIWSFPLCCSLALNVILTITFAIIGFNLVNYNFVLSDTNAALRLTNINNGILIQRLTEYEERFKESVKHVKKTIKVAVTMYHPVKGQTDDRPNETADGTIIKVDEASNYRYIALSRNLHKRYGGPFEFGDFVYISAIRKSKLGDVIADKSGFYKVKDLMNKRFMNRVDILESIGVKPYKFESASLYKIEMNQVE